jgi:hypothetical protein
MIINGRPGETSRKGREKGEGDRVNTIEVHYIYIQNFIMKPLKTVKK